jgi:hypothetical protein
MTKEFVAYHPLTGKMILICAVKDGYIEYPGTQERMNQLNAVNNNTDNDILSALQRALWNYDTNQKTA